MVLLVANSGSEGRSTSLGPKLSFAGRARHSGTLHPEPDITGVRSCEILGI